MVYSETDRVGRGPEVEVLLSSVDRARQGKGGSLLVCAEPGLGKTYLLDEVEAPSAGSAGLTLLRTSAPEFESHMPYAALEELLRPLARLHGRLSGPQQEALTTAFGQGFGAPPEPLLVGLAVAGLLAETAPGICMVDDAHWLDHASAEALAVAARRLTDLGVLLVLTTRPDDRIERLFDGIPALTLQPLRYEESAALLRQVLTGPLDRRVRDQILAEAQGNPLAIVELVRSAGPRLAGGFGMPESPKGHAAATRVYEERLSALPGSTRALLALVAAEPTGDWRLFREAADRLGLPVEDLDEAADKGFVTLGLRLRFRHPLMRSTVYWCTPARQLRAVHAALAKVTDPQTDPERLAWHRSRSIRGTDDELAGQLVALSDRARERGGAAAAAYFLEQAAALSSLPSARAGLLLRGGEEWHRSGDFERARDLVSAALPDLAEPAAKARASMLLAEVAFDRRHGRDEAEALLAAARAVAELEPSRAAEASLRGLRGLLIAGTYEGSAASPPRVVAESAHGSWADPARIVLDSLLPGLGGDTPASIEAARRAVRVLREEDGTGANLDFMWTWLVCALAWDDEAALELGERYLAGIERSGQVSDGSFGLSCMVMIRLHQGRFREAEALSARVRTVQELTGDWESLSADIWIAAYGGDPKEVDELAALLELRADAGGRQRVHSRIAYAKLVALNGAGRYEQAVTVVRPGPLPVGFLPFIPAELVEAHAQLGALDEARAQYVATADLALQAATPWSLGLERRCRALVSADPDEVEDAYRASIAHLAAGISPVQRARSQLLYGEWLRRRRRRAEAREQLRAAYETLSAARAAGFAERAARELRAAGESPRAHLGFGNGLTPQEMAIARLASTGATSREIAAELVISRRTVDAHLRSIFDKLGVRSRRRIAPALRELSVS
jgi:DNA-binding CsgD family transcriptional regulator